MPGFEPACSYVSKYYCPVIYVYCSSIPLCGSALYHCKSAMSEEDKLATPDEDDLMPWVHAGEPCSDVHL